MADCGKVALVIEAFSEGLTADEVAKSLGYKNRKGVSQLMRRAGYRWDERAVNYVFSKGTKPDDSAGNGVQLNAEAKQLLERASEVLKLLDIGYSAMAVSLSSPLLKGYLVSKNLRLPHPLCEAVEEFARQNRLTQRAIFECALVDFLRSRGGITDETE